jgi:flagellar protein FliO/FliZ
VTELVLRIVFSLLVVLGVMWAVARLARRPLARRGDPALALLARQQLSRGASVAVLRVLDRALVLGVTDQHVTLLGEADPTGFARAAPATEHREPLSMEQLQGLLSPARRRWSGLLDQLRDRTGRRP